jgi:ferric-dicitrate binding protein FerR (iron transport regulator)
MLVNNSDTSVSTAIAETKTIELPQGSLVELDAVSTLTFNEKDWEKTRSLSLVGQAFFDVTSGVPFEVNTPIAKVEVLGTQFNIKTEKERFSVECFEGKIKVSFKGNTEIITKGQRVTIDNGVLLRLDHQKTNPEWLKGLSSYNKTPLEEVIADVQRYYDLDITLPKKYQSLLFTGSFKHHDLKGTLHTIFTTMEVKYTLYENRKVIFE